jgi:hypothetical protein
MTHEYLFIGGTADGKRFDVPEHIGEWTIRSLHSRQVPSVYDDESAQFARFETIRTVETRYRKLSFTPQAECFVDARLRDEQVLKMLVEGYNPQNK